MYNNSHLSNRPFSYDKSKTPSINGSDMFNYLAKILEADGLVEYSPLGIIFTIKGYILVEDFGDTEVQSRKHIGYEKI